jgi:hypothetical protein
MEHELLVPAVPQSVSEFLSLRNELATTPQGAAAAFVLALMAYASDKAFGLTCLTTVIDASRLQEGTAGVQGKEPRRADQQAFRDYLGSRPHLARSYVQGTTPENGYQPPTPPWRVRIKEQPSDVQADQARVFVFCTGADSPRPLRLRRNTAGVWKATEWSSLLVGIRSPVAQADEI